MVPLSVSRGVAAGSNLVSLVGCAMPAALRQISKAPACTSMSVGGQCIVSAVGYRDCLHLR